jgi:hypothetical protein
MSRVTWIEHRGKRILFSDYANLSTEELIESVKEVNATFPEYQHLSPGSVLALIDFENIHVSKEVISVLKNSAVLWRPLYKKQAVIGLSPLQYMFVTAVNKFSTTDFTPFKSKIEALVWLVAD